MGNAGLLGTKKNSELWGITSFFNPMRYRLPVSNYHLFRRHLTIPLVTVEVGYDGLFDLRPGDADILVQLPGKDVLWQKERLLNLALAKVPASCSKVAWLDGDLLFERAEWANHACDLLDEFPLVQVFGDLVDLPAGFREGDSMAFPEAELRPSFGCLMRAAQQQGEAKILAKDRRYLPGGGWAFRREVFAHRGLYDADILGAADSFNACAMVLHFQGERVEFPPEFNGWMHDIKQMNDRQREHYFRWAGPFYEEIRGRISYVPGRVFHLWHGDIENRRYNTRYQELSPFRFDPFEDIAHNEHGCWRWNSAKPELHEHIRNYFAGRRNDG